jgi:N-acetylglutamate synthase-like GNAT family acetyltransferase
MHASWNHVQVKKAEPLILPQVKRFYRQHGFRPQAPRTDDIYIAILDAQIVGAVRLCPLEDCWLLRSMCIHCDYRGRGIGSYLLQRLQQVLRQKTCYCFPYSHLQGFDQDNGFEPVTDKAVPQEIMAKYRNYRSKGKDILLMAI